MDYNGIMKSRIRSTDVVRLIRYAALLWIGYVAALAVINQFLWYPPGRVSIVSLIYYILLGSVAALCLGLSFLSWIQKRLGSVFIPVVVAVITVLPILDTWLATSFFSHGPPPNTESSTLILLPFLLVSFLLVAWQYRWQFMLLIIIAIVGLNLAELWSFPMPNPPPFQIVLTITLIQTVVFLTVGFTISYLMNRLRKQQQSLEAANVRLTHYTSTLEQLTIVRERGRLARELHDTLAHTLSGLAVQLETVKAYWNVDDKMARSSLETSLATARSGLEETRRALKALRATPLDDLGLSQAIKTMAEYVAARSGLSLDTSIVTEMPPLSPDVEQSVYRIAQEAIANVANHANAKTLTLRLESVEGKVILTVSDDGVGFAMDRVNKSNQFGLTGMQERAQLVGGDLDIASDPGRGTTIRLSVSQETRPLK